MKRTLLNLYRVVMSFRRVLPVFLFALGCLSDCVFKKTITKVMQLRFIFTSYSNSPETKLTFVRNSLISTLLFLVIAVNSMAEGTKQLEPTTPNAANGSLGLVLYQGGWTANGQRIPFATVGCAPDYRLNVYISDPSTEIIYFGFKQSTAFPLYYQLRDPDGLVVPGFALTSQPTVGNPGYIPNWTQAVAGPKFGAMNPTGYTPLVLTPTKVGNYYLEFAGDAAGATTNMTGTTIEYIDVSVYQGNNVKNGRLWSKAWQFDDQIAGGNSPQTNFYILSDDSIVTKLNINRWHGMHYMFYCNHWGAVNTGNWYSDRLSRTATSQATWPGDFPQYKIFLNDPDSIIYPTGAFGKICDVVADSKCDGSVDFLLKVNKPGKIELTIDADPKGINNGEDVKLNADVKGSPGCTTWDTIAWNGMNGFGQLLANGATTSVQVDYLNGLTHLPIYDIETNTHGIMVDLVRPVPSGSSKLNIYWDDTQVPNCGPVCINQTGCIYANAANACHTWPANNQGNLVIFNSWWYYLSGSAALSPIIKRLPETPTASPSGPSPICVGQTNVQYTISPIQFAESYLWTLPNGTTITTASNSVSLNFPSTSSGGPLMVQGLNTNCGVGNYSPPLLITVNPTPVVTATPNPQTVCSGETTNIALSSTALNTTYTWTATAPGSLSGFSNGSGNSIAQTLFNTSNASHYVTYIITPVSGGCTGVPITVIVTVQPANTVNTLPLSQTICSGSTVNLNLSATLPGTSFSWTVSGIGISGYSDGSGNVISQTLINFTSIPRNAVYLVTGTLNSCTTSITAYTITVNNLLAQYSLAGGGEYCTGGPGVLVGLTSSQAGVNYQLFNNGNAVGSPVPGTGLPISFGNQTLAGAYTIEGTSATTGCTAYMGNSVTVTVNPLPLANAGADLTIPFGINTLLNGSVSGGTTPYNYSWSPVANIAMGATTSTPLTTNLYSNTTFNLLVSDGKGCIDNDQVTVSLSGSALNVAVAANPIVICNDVSQSQLSCATSGGSGSYSYTWTSIPAGSPAWTSSQQNPWVSPDSTTIYNVEVNDGYNKATASVPVIVHPLPAQYNITGGGSYCASGNGVPIGLSGSQTNIEYQLFQGGGPVGPVVFGTGNPISFGNQAAALNYTVVATNMITGCVNSMIGNVTSTENPLPTIFKIDPIGQQCPGTIIRLNGSDPGVIYYLLLDGFPVDSIPGTGVVGFLDFGPRTANGTYTISAVNLTTGCQSIMNGSTYITIAPRIYNVIPAGILCPGQMISLSGSEVGVSYQLRWNDTFDLGAPVPGTGSPIDMGIGSLPGVYTVIATGNSTNCVSYMDDSATLYPNPVVFSIVPDGEACEGTEIILNGSESGVDYILLLDNAIHIDTIHGTGSALNFGAQLTAGNYTIIAVIQNSYCITQMNGVAVLNDRPIKYDVVPAGIICIGNSVGVASSQVGVSYQLLFNGIINIGTPVAGTGNPISFGAQTFVGSYTVRALNDVTGCNSMMNGSADLVPLPKVYQVSPSGNHCAGTSISLNGSETNFNYILVLNGSINLDTIAGTGSAIDFGPQIIAGTYTIVAFSSGTFCKTDMSGSSNIDARPLLLNMTPAGVACSGDNLGLDNSETGVNYQLRRDGIINVGSPVTGTGSAISFGIQTIPGVYSVEAAGSNGCVAVMNGTVTLHPFLVVFTILPGGNQCPGSIVKLNGSETGINYILLRDGISPIDTLAGTGGMLDFGTPMIAGTYTVLAYSTAALCQSVMNGSTIIMLSPAPFNVTPAGINCLGSSIGMDNSETGVNYQLRRNGIVNVGAPVAGTGSAISFGVINIPGSYTVIGVSTANNCPTIMTGTVEIQPLPLVFTVNPQGFQCSGTSITLNGSQVGTDYVLILDNTFNIDTLTGTGGILNFGQQLVTGTYTIEAIAGATTCQAVMNGSTQIIAIPANFNITPAGLNCASVIAGLDGSETGINYTLYKNGITTGLTIAGTGSAISFGTQTAGNYTVKAVNQNSNCSIFMPGTLQISNPPLVNIGSDATICVSQAVMLNATVNQGGITTWSTSGDGTFHNTGTLHPMYTPGIDDITNGTVYLLLTAQGTGSCIANAVTDTLKLTIDHPATANAGGNIDVCAAADYTISGASATNYSTVNWTSSGTGSFVNGSTLTPTYAPSATDITSGSLNLTMHVTGNSPCSNTATDVITMTFHTIVTVDAGPGATIGYTDTFTAASATVQNSALVQWTTSGSGSFDNVSVVNATYTPSAADHAKGSVILSLTAFNHPPCGQVTDTLTLRFFKNWGVDFTWFPSCDAQPVAFIVNPDITNINATTSWLWNFGDGTTSNLMNPTHLFPALGGYKVTLTATDTAGSVKVISHHITISQFPVAFFSSSIPNCSNELVNLTDLSHTLYGYISEWVWNYGDGTPDDTIHFPDQPNISHLFNSAGSYNVTLSVTNSYGCHSSATIPVEVIEAPIANFQYTEDCSGLETSFLDASYANGPGNTVQYWWAFGDPSTGADNYSDKKDATHIFSAPGTYQVMHIVRNFNNCTDTIVKPVVILKPLKVDFIYGHTCLDGKSNFSPDSSVMNIANITTWEWNFGDGVTNNQQSTNHAYTGTGSYQVTLTVHDISGCTASKTRTVVVNPLPVAMFNTTQLNCANTPVHFGNASNTYAGFITKWNWDFGDGNTKQILYPGNPDTDHTYSAPGTYIVTLTITSSDSCTAVRQQSLEIIPAAVANFDYTNACQGTPVPFSDLTQTSGAGVINGWTWDFGDGASGSNNTSTLQNPTHTYIATGTYQVTLNVSTANGCSSNVVKTIIITSAPFVDFSFDNQCAASGIRFSPASTVTAAEVAAWNWSFGDGVTSAESNPQHAYNTPGNYNVTLTITSTSGCQNTISHVLTILPTPVAKFNTSTPACSQQQVAFTNQSEAPVGYIMHWEYNFGDGTHTTINYPGNPNISHTYSAYGTYTATLTVITNNNCSATTSQNIRILPGPLANFDYNASCLEVPVQFNDLSQGKLISWKWNFGDAGSGADNTSNQQHPVHTFQQSGNFAITLVVQNANGCQDTITRSLAIGTKPALDFSFNSGCASDTVHFNSTNYINSANTSSWLWNFGDNTTSVDADPYHIYATPGNYNVSLTITNQNGCTNVKTRILQVSAAPIAMYTNTSLSCSGTAVLFTDFSSTPVGIINSWNWNFGDGTNVTVNAPSDPTVSHVFSAPGNYKVTLTINTSTGCYADHSNWVKIIAAPATAFSYASNCNDAPTTFTDHSQGAGGSAITRWNWNFDDPVSGINNISDLQNPQHRFSGQGIYNVTLTTENAAGCTNTMIQAITIKPDKDINFTVSSSCNGTPVTFAADTAVITIADVSSYLWDFGDGSSNSVLAEPSHLFAHSGNYNVTLTITKVSGCKISVSKIVSIHNWPVAQFTTNGNCATNVVEFTDISFSPDGEKIVAWAWDFGVNASSGTSTVQNPRYIYAAEGTYHVKLTITTASGCTAVKVMPITVIAAPTALFSYIAEPCHNGSVLFRDESVSTQSMITGWQWEFAPGIFSSLQNPVHVFGDSDTCYNVKLVVTTANGCTNTFIQKVCIPTGIKIAINYSQACFGETTRFTPAVVQPAGGTVVSYNWNFGDPSTGFYNESKLANPQHTFSKPGNFIVSLQASDNSNCSTTRYMSITVDALPKAAFEYSGGLCDSLVRFKDMTTGAKITRWIWHFGDGKSKIIDAPANPNVTHYYSYPGVYEAVLMAQSEAGCYDTTIKTVRRTPCITAAFAVNDQVVCQKRSMKFTETSTCQAPIASWQWFFGDNTSATFTSPQTFVEHTYAVAGNYTVKMVVATQMVGGLATDTATNQVAVKPSAKAAYAWQEVCMGQSTNFDNLTQNNNTTIKSYLWNFGDPGTISDTTSVKSPGYKYEQSGEYDVKLVVTNTLGCTDTVVKKVNIFSGPAADFSWNNSCEAKPVIFTVVPETTSSSIVNWNWKFSSEGQVLDASANRNFSTTFAHAGIYDADLKVTDRNGCSTIISKQVTVAPNPVAAFNIVENYENKQGQIMLSNGTINGTEYEWDFGNGKTSTAPAPVITFDREGHYTIQLIASNGQNCTDTITLEYNLMYKGLYVPNAFNPGNIDPEVAVFRPKGTNLKSYLLEIYDRWGNLLWSSSKIDNKGSPAESWDGKLHGEILTQDVYVWKISAQFNDGEVWDGTNTGNNKNIPQKKAGTVTLIR